MRTTAPLLHVKLDLVWSLPAIVTPGDLSGDGVDITVRLVSGYEYIEFAEWEVSSRRHPGFTMEADVEQDNGMKWATASTDAGPLYYYVGHDAQQLTFKIKIADYGAQLNERVVLRATTDLVRPRRGMHVIVEPDTTLADTMTTSFRVNVPEEEWQLGTVGVSAGTTVLIGASALQTQTTAFLAVMECGSYKDDDPKIPWMFHPTQVEIAGRRCMGAVVVNMSFVAFAIAVQVAVAYAILKTDVAGRFMEEPRTFRVAQAVVFFPSFAIIILICFYQGTSVCASALLFRPSDAGDATVGVITLMVLIVFIIWLARAMTSAEKLARYRLDMDEDGKQRGSKLLLFVLGHGEWVSTCKSTRVTKRYSVVFRTWASSFTAWATMDFVAALLFAFIGTYRPESYPGCGNLRLIIGAVSFAFGAVTLFYWPYVKERDNHTQIWRWVLQGIGFVLLGIAYHIGEPTTHATVKAGSVFILASVVLLLIKALIDLFAFIYIVYTQRRTRLQLEEWGDHQKALRTLGEAAEDAEMHENKETTELAEVPYRDSVENKLSWEGMLNDIAMMSSVRDSRRKSVTLEEPLLRSECSDEESDSASTSHLSPMGVSRNGRLPSEGSPETYNGLGTAGSLRNKLGARNHSSPGLGFRRGYSSPRLERHQSARKPISPILIPSTSTGDVDLEDPFSEIGSRRGSSAPKAEYGGRGGPLASSVLSPSSVMSPTSV